MYSSHAYVFRALKYYIFETSRLRVMTNHPTSPHPTVGSLTSHTEGYWARTWPVHQPCLMVWEERAGPSVLCRAILTLPTRSKKQDRRRSKMARPKSDTSCLLPAHTEPQRARVGKGQRSGLITSSAPLRFWKNSTNQIIIPSPKIWQNVLSAVSGTKRTTVTSG